MVLPLAATVMATALMGTAVHGWAADSQNAQRFISVIEDLPLMAGLSEVGEGVQFSTSQGRIAEVTTMGKVKREAVISFYESTLPQLGWKRVAKGRFAREEETLELVFEKKRAELKRKIRFSPQKYALIRVDGGPRGIYNAASVEA